MAWYGRIPVYGASISTFFDDDLGEQGAAIAGTSRQYGGRATSRFEVSLGPWGIRSIHDGWTTAVRFLANTSIERQLTQQSDSVLFEPSARRPPAPKMCSAWPQFEQKWMLMFLDDAEYGHADLLKHLEALARIGKGDVLRRCHNNGASDWVLAVRG